MALNRSCAVGDARGAQAIATWPTRLQCASRCSTARASRAQPRTAELLKEQAGRSPIGDADRNDYAQTIVINYGVG